MIKKSFIRKYAAKLTEEQLNDKQLTKGQSKSAFKTAIKRVLISALGGAALGGGIGAIGYGLEPGFKFPLSQKGMQRGAALGSLLGLGWGAIAGDAYNRYKMRNYER